MKDSVLMAQPFNPGRLTPPGEPVPLVDKIGLMPGACKTAFSNSANSRRASVAKSTEGAGER